MIRSVYIGVALANGTHEIWDFAGWVEMGPQGRVEVIRGLTQAVAWAERHRALRGTPPVDLERYVNATAKYLSKSSEFEGKSAESHVREIATAAVTATSSSIVPETEDPGP